MAYGLCPECGLWKQLRGDYCRACNAMLALMNAPTPIPRPDTAEEETPTEGPRVVQGQVTFHIPLDVLNEWLAASLEEAARRERESEPQN